MARLAPLADGAGRSTPAGILSTAALENQSG